MTVYVENNRFGYELQRVAQMFFPGEKVLVEQGAPPKDAEDWLHALLAGDRLEVRARLRDPAGAPGLSSAEEGAFAPKQAASLLGWDELEPGDTDADAEHKFGVLFYRLLSGFTGIRPQWGVLTGVRPVKLMVSALEAGLDEPALRERFMGKCLMGEERYRLALRTARAQRPILARSTPDSFSLYVSIPFCPTRCAYCSFVSHSVEQAAKLIPAYVGRLCDELRETARIAGKLGLRLRTVYFGGGTPTTLSADQLRRVTGTIAECFDLSGVWEYTVEAGRPDTVTPEKLRAIREAGAGRVSVNPQTLSDAVLENIGRKHTSARTLEAYRMAREAGFDCINMDLIAGLPGDTPEGFRRSVDGVIALAPENVTVHTLTVKRSARLTFAQAREELALVGGMVDASRHALGEAGYLPYYLYRQNGTLANLENVGYATPGTEGLYNVYIMDETHSILAVGAGGSTKLRRPETGDIERIFNYKYPYEYIERFETVLQRKARILEFYGA